MEAVTSIHSTNPSLNSLECIYIDDFIQNYDLNGNYKSKEGKLHNHSIYIESPSSFANAHDIVAIYQNVYNGTYPFKEMLDEDYVFQTFSDSTYFWKIFTSSEPNTPSQIIGCFTIVVDEEQKRAYMRGLNIRKDFQGKVKVRNLSYAMIRQFFQEHPNQIYSWYNESRTEHSIVQYLSNHIAAKPYAFFAGKDYFNLEKESDMLMVAYTSDALHKYRQIPAAIHHSLAGLYFRIAYMHHFDTIPPIQSPKIPQINPCEITSEIEKCMIYIKEDKYGYSHITFTLPETHESMTFLHTHTVNNIEKIHFDYHKFSTMLAFMALLMKYAEEKAIEYIEITIPASDIQLTEYFLQSNYNIAGYVPAWIPSKMHPKMMEDAVIFSWHTPHITIPEPKLIMDSIHLTSILDSSNNIVRPTKDQSIQMNYTLLQPIKSLF
ncbi:hypothetical protein [Candidatus Lokiarchaeum ossiferum]|uniref:hypothetical protein n=1 Tax=Candidatus Lokiarchaeum ossiferum TaxID=2951803 RepID=UPI00352E46AA